MSKTKLTITVIILAGFLNFAVNGTTTAQDSATKHGTSANTKTSSYLASIGE